MLKLTVDVQVYHWKLLSLCRLTALVTIRNQIFPWLYRNMFPTKEKTYQYNNGNCSSGYEPQIVDNIRNQNAKETNPQDFIFHSCRRMPPAPLLLLLSCVVKIQQPKTNVFYLPSQGREMRVPTK